MNTVSPLSYTEMHLLWEAYLCTKELGLNFLDLGKWAWRPPSLAPRQFYISPLWTLKTDRSTHRQGQIAHVHGMTPGFLLPSRTLYHGTCYRTCSIFSLMSLQLYALLWKKKWCCWAEDRPEELWRTVEACLSAWFHLCQSICPSPCPTSHPQDNQRENPQIMSVEWKKPGSLEEMKEWMQLQQTWLGVQAYFSPGKRSELVQRIHQKWRKGRGRLRVSSCLFW